MVIFEMRNNFVYKCIISDIIFVGIQYFIKYEVQEEKENK